MTIKMPRKILAVKESFIIFLDKWHANGTRDMARPQSVLSTALALAVFSGLGLS